MPTYYKFKTVDEAEAIDENGCLRDGHSVRVGMLDAMAARHELSDADRYVMEDAQHRRAAAGNRPGYRFVNNQEYRDSRVIVETAYADAEAANRDAWKGEAFTGQRGSKVGDPCTKDGWPGFLAINDDGELYCEISPHAPGASDAAFDDRDAAYFEYEDRITNMWRMK